MKLAYVKFYHSKRKLASTLSMPPKLWTARTHTAGIILCLILRCKKQPRRDNMSRFMACCFFVFTFGKVSHIPSLFLIHYVAEDGRELLSFRPLPPKCWKYRCGQLCATMTSLFSIRDQTQIFMHGKHGYILNDLQRPPSRKLHPQFQSCYNSERLQWLMNWNQNRTLTLLNKHKSLACNQYF